MPPRPIAAPAGARRYLAAAATLAPQGDGTHRARVGARDHVLTGAERAALLACERLRPLDDHAGAQPTPERARAVPALAARGLLVGEDELLARLAERRPVEPPPPPLERLTVFSCARPALAVAAVREHLEAARGAARPLTITVVDDARAPAATEVVRQGLTGFAGVHVVDRAEREGLAASLARAAGVEEALVREAVLGSDPTGPTGGAARSAALLLAAGDLLATTDDDAHAAAGVPAGVRDDLLRIARSADPTRLAVFRAREAAFAALRPEERPAFACFDAVLGRACATLATEHPGERELDVAVHRVLEANPGEAARVRLAALGLAGDAGASHPAYPLLAGPRDRAALIDAWGSARYSREQVRCAPAVTLSSSPFFMSGFAAFDARSLLPPFLPDGRAPDATFAAVLRRMAPADLVAHLPRVHLHDPPERRAHADPLEVLACPSANELLPAVIAKLPVSAPCATERLVELGGALRGVATDATLPWLLDAQIRAIATARVARLTEALEAAAAYPGGAAFAEDVEDALHRVRETLARPRLAPRDHPRDALGAVAARWSSYGAILEAWPRIFSAAARRRGAAG
ncbi:MAG: hypothetical protein IT376_16320 [Polyangiaceae bacterium]|nr:hypothetical protein [Polyangiaceae bacterium]